MSHKLSGIISALITPFDSKGDVNHSVLRTLVQYALKQRVAGFYLCGSTGEGLLMSEQERMAVVDTICNEARASASVVVNVSHMERPVVLRLAAHAAKAGADAISTLPPLYFPISAEEHEAYFLGLMDSCALPLTLYNIPALSHVSLTEAMVRRLAEHPKFLGIKHATEDTYLLSQFKQIADRRLLVWSARDAYYLPALASGADGAIGSSFILTGPVFIKITEAYRAGKVDLARRLQERINAVHFRLQRYGPYKSYKRCFELMGIAAGNCRSPHLPIVPEADEYLRQTLALLETVKTEANQAEI